MPVLFILIGLLALNGVTPILAYSLSQETKLVIVMANRNIKRHILLLLVLMILNPSYTAI